MLFFKPTFKQQKQRLLDAAEKIKHKMERTKNDSLKRALSHIRKELCDLAKSYKKPLNEISTIEKCQAFNELYEMCSTHFDYTVDNNDEPKDGDHYIFEKAFKVCLGDNIFDIMNNFL